MSTDVKKLLIFSISFILTVYMVDAALSALLEQAYSRMKGGERGRADFAIRKSRADLYIFGSSRALGHYDPKIFYSVLKKKSYNAGRPAQSILYHLSLFKLILARHTPDIVILDLNETELIYDYKKYELMSSLLPYYSEPTVKETLTKIDSRYKFNNYFSVLKYNSSIGAIIYRSVFSKNDESMDGFIPYKGFRSSSEIVNDNCNDSLNIDPKLVQSLMEFQKLCKEKGIRLVIAISPRFATYKCKQIDLLYLQEEVQRLGIEFLDYSSNRRFIENKAFMYDVAHLNETGAKEYSHEIASYLIHGK